jgi:nicotinate-nucleotide pyrophosphorylase (carboxylating)
MALAEDLPDGDRTSDTLFPDAVGSFPDGHRRGGWALRARCIARAEGVVSGVPVVERLFAALDPRVEVAVLRRDGDTVRDGDAILEVSGPAASVLRGERAALNFIGRLCGIATGVSRWIAALAGSQATLLDTRKTTPGWRRLEKYAVRCGGGTNHRESLSDGILVKDNHREILAAAGVDDFATWVDAFRRDCAGSFLQVEVDDRDEFLAARCCSVDSILLDNFGLEDLRWAVEKNRELPAPRPSLEASGGIRLENVREIAATGVDRISVGALTHSAVSLDVSLETVGIDDAKPASNISSGAES